MKTTITKTEPFEAPDFKAELEQNERNLTRLKFLLSQAAEQQKALRLRFEEQLKNLKMRHKLEVEQARDQAFAEGKKAGLIEGHTSVEQALVHLEEYTNKLVENEKNFLRHAEKHVVTLAIAVAKRILGREVETDKEIIVFSVREALKQVADKARIIIKVNPEDLENILLHRKALQKMDRNFPELEFEADEKISRGGCIIQTRTGVIDGRLTSQLEEIERNFIRGL